MIPLVKIVPIEKIQNLFFFKNFTFGTVLDKTKPILSQALFLG
jgi:hypothetical protein